MLTIAEINDNASYVFKSFNDRHQKGVYFRIQILFKGTYSFHLDKTPKRYFNEKQEQLYKYPPGYLKLKKIDEGEPKSLGYFLSRTRTLYHSWDL